MAATKTALTLLTSQSLAANASVSMTALDMTGYDAVSIFVRITNGATAPTTAPVVTFYAGEISTKKYVRGAPVAGDTVNSSVNDFEMEYELQHMFANVTITNGATNAVTVEIYGQAGLL